MTNTNKFYTYIIYRYFQKQYSNESYIADIINNLLVIVLTVNSNRCNAMLYTMKTTELTSVMYETCVFIPRFQIVLPPLVDCKVTNLVRF